MRRTASALAAAIAATACVAATISLPSAGAESAPVVLMGAGDIANCGVSPADAEATGDLIRTANPDHVFTAGDNAYPDGSTSEYQDCYGPAWGSFKAKTLPTVGNHEYHTEGAQGFKDYFGLPTWYAQDLGNGWRYYALNSERSMYSGSAQAPLARERPGGSPERAHRGRVAHPPVLQRFTRAQHRRVPPVGHPRRTSC